MFKINCYRYVDRSTGSKFEIYSRDVFLADSLAQRISALGIFNLKRKRIRFCKLMCTDIPPYELEQEQISAVEEWEKIKLRNKE